MYESDSLTPSLSSEAILELFGDNKLNSLSDRERHNLAMLKDGNKKGSLGLLWAPITQNCYSLRVPLNKEHSLNIKDWN